MPLTLMSAPAGPIEQAASNVAVAQAWAAREIAERNRLRALIAMIDKVIDTLEERNLHGQRDVPVPTRLAARVDRLIGRIGPALDEEAGPTLSERPLDSLIPTAVMDVLYDEQNRIMEAMYPGKDTWGEANEPCSVMLTEIRLRIRDQMRAERYADMRAGVR